MTFPSTVFVPGTTITHEWLNGVNDAIVDGSANINYTPPFTGGVTTTIGNKLSQTVSVIDFGAVGDGVTDDTAAIQAALDSSSFVTIPPGIYAITNRIYTPDNCTLFGYGATLLCTSSSSTGTGLYITDATFTSGVNNVTVYGLKIDGNRNNRTPPGNGALFYISSGSNHTLVDCIAVNSTIDGFQVAGDLTWTGGINKNTRFYNCEADNSYRNGLSIVGTDNFVDVGGKYHDTNGASPQMGVDIEPNDANSRNYGFAFYGTTVYNNTKTGISINASSGTNTTGLLSCVVSKDNGGYGIQSDQPAADVRIHAPQCSNNTDGSFDISEYAFDQDSLTNRQISSTYFEYTSTQTFSSSSWTDVPNTTFTVTTPYPNSRIRFNIKYNYVLLSTAAQTQVTANVRLIRVSDSAVIDVNTLSLHGASGTLETSATGYISGQYDQLVKDSVDYKLQVQYTSGGGQISLSYISGIADVICLG